MTLNSISRTGLIVLLLGLSLAACTSRYRLNLFLVEGENRNKVDVEKTEFMAGAVLDDPSSQEKVRAGDGNVLVLITGFRGQSETTEGHNLMSYDKHIRYRLFIELAPIVEPGEVELRDRSLVQQMGRYEVSAEDKLYYPERGHLIVDSIAGNRLFGTIDGYYRNRLDHDLKFEGRFKAKISN